MDMNRKFSTKRQNLIRNIAALFVGGAILSPNMVPEAKAITITWDANNITAAQTDGAGAWLGGNQWWDGATNVSWTSGDDAIFGNAGAGGAVTLASPTTVNSLTFNTFTGTYTLGTAGQAITLNNGITMNAGAGAVTLISPITLGAAQSWTNNSTSNLTPQAGINNNGFLLTIDGTGNTVMNTTANVISGSGGLTKTGTGLLTLGAGGTNPVHTYTGTTTISGGTLMVYNIGTTGIPSGNLTINGGVLQDYFGNGGSFTRALGSGAGQVQITGGASGFSAQGATSTTFNVGGAGATLVWGSAFFSPSTFILQAANAGVNTNAKLSLTNGIDLNATNRTIASMATTDGGATSGATIAGVISNSTGTAGFEKTGVGNLILGSAANTFNGPLTITNGWITAGSSGSLGNGSVTNTLVFNGGILRATGAITSPATRAVTMTSTGIIDNNGFAISIAGDTGGAGGLTKNGAGTLTLSGTNNYSGVTTVNTGTLSITKETSLASNTAANVNVKSSATLQLNVDSAGSAGFTSANLSTLLGNISVANTAVQGLQAGAILVLDTSTATGGTFTQGNAITNSTGAFGGAIALTKLGAGTLILDKANTYTGPTTISAGTLQLDAGGVIATPIGNNATFAINSAGSVTQGTNFGLISGTGAVTNAGAGTLTLNLANTYSGLTTATAGTIALTNALAIQNSALVTTSGTSTYSGSAALTIGGLSGATGDLGSANVLNGYTGLVTSLTLNPQTGVTVTYGGVISDGSGAMTLTKTGAGTQILTGANTYTGPTIVNAGTLTIGVGGSISSSSALQINGGTFSNSNTAGQTLNGFTVGAGNATVSNTAASGTLALGAITRTPSLFGTVNFATLTGPISTTTGNTNGIIGPWATTGSTTTLRYAVGSPDGSTPTNITPFTTGTTATANTLANVTDATMNYEYSAAVAAMPASTALTGNTLRYSGGATTTAINATSTLTLNGLMQAGTGLLTISGGPTTGGILIGSTGELVIVANNQPTTISAAIGGTGRLVYSGVGSILLSSASSSYSGGTVINSGELRIASDAALGNSSGSITLNGGALRGNNTNPQSGNTGGVNITSARDVIVGVAGGTIGAQGNNSFTTTGVLSGNGTLTFLETGGAGGRSLNFNSTSNTFTGRLVIPSIESTLSVNSLVDTAGSGNIALNLGAANSGSTFAYGAGATSGLTLNNRAIELNAAGTFTGTIQNNNTTQAISIGSNLIATGTGAKTLVLGTVGTATVPANVFSGIISNGTGGGNVALTKTGPGLWTLGGANTYTGATTVSAGRLSLTNLNAIANTSSVTVASGGTLGFAVLAGGTYSVPGTINIAGTGASLPGGAGALWFGQGASYTSTLNAPINLTAAATIGSFGNVMTQNLGGAITGTGPLTIQSQGGSTTDTATWNLNAASTYSGNTIFTTSGGVRDMTIKLGVDNALPITTSLNLQPSNSQAVNTFTTFDLNGRNQTLTGLTDTGSTPPAANTVGKRVINSSGTLSTLTINNAGAVTYGTTGTRILGGTIGGLDAAGNAANNVALVKNGVGTLSLTGASSFTGDVTISAGTLTASLLSTVSNPTVSPLGNPQTPGRQVLVGSAGTLNFGTSDVMGNGGTTPLLKLVANGGTIRNTGAVFNAIGPVDLNGGTLSSFGGSSGAFPSFYLNGTVTVGGSAVSTISSTGTNSQMGLRSTGTTFDVADAVVGSGSDLNVTGVLANFNSIAGALVKSGPGTMTLTGTNTYTGPTNVNAGTLIVGVSGVGSIGASTTTVANGATLGGSGSIGGNTTIQSGATLAPGNSPGTMTYNNANLIWNNGGNYNWQVLNATGTAGTGYDTINITGTGILDLSALSGAPDFNINLQSLLSIGPDTPGIAANFINTNPYTWTLVSTPTVITGFAAGNFTINTAGFTNSLGGGSFSVDLADANTDLVLKFTPGSGGGAPDLAVGTITNGNLFVLQNAALTTSTATVALSNVNSDTGSVNGFTTSLPGVLSATTGQTISGSGPITPSSQISLLSTGTNTTALGATVAYTTNPADTTPDNNTATVNVRIGNAPLAASSTSTNFGSALIAATPSGNTYTNLASNTLEVSQVASTGGPVKLGTMATILSYNNSTAGDSGIVSMAWRTRTAAEGKNTETLQGGGTNTGGVAIGYLISDVVKLTGMANNGLENGITDTFVLQMSYDELLLGIDAPTAADHELRGAALGHIFLAWNNGGTWQNAVTGNTGGAPAFFNRAYQAGDETFLGRWGVDINNNVAWAVLNHNSEFAVIPEPSTLVLGGLALLGFAGVGLRRRRMSK